MPVHRITAQLSTRFALQGIRNQSVKASDAQIRLATGKRVQKPSDDPIAYRSIASLRAELRRIESETTRIEQARGTLNNSLTRVTELRSQITSASVAAQQGRDGSNRATHAGTLDSVIEQLVRLGNDQSEGRYVFGGANPSQPPLEVERDDTGRVTAVRFVGSEEPMTTPIGGQFSVDISTPAREIFGGSGVASPLQSTARTGVAPGTGADSYRGTGTIEIVNTGLSFAAGSGVLAGADSPTIAGPLGANTLTIVDQSGTGAFGVVSLNGAGDVPFTSADTNLEVTGANGEKIFLDLSAVTPGFNGSVDIQADASISVDGGLSSVPVDFSTNQQLIHSETGEAVNVDTTNVRFTGEDVFGHPGSGDLFETLITLRDDLLGRRGLDEQEYQDSITTHLGELERLTDHVLDHIGEQAVALENLDSVQALREDIELETKISLSELEDANTATAILDLQAAQSVLETTYASTARIFGTSLLDYL